MAYIIYKSNKIELENKSTSIGRGKNADILIEDATVSRNHAIIKLIGQKYYVIDSGSSNGTFKDGKKLYNPTLLEDKSLIQFGNIQIIFYEDILEDDEDDETMISFDSNVIINSIVLVADIKGYTSFSESVDIQIVSKFMSLWLKYTSECVEKNKGYVDSFIGDCIYARWDAKIDDKDLILDIIKISKQLNDITLDISAKVTNGEYKLSLGAGINMGDVVTGTQTNNTGLGDTVNTTFRLEATTRGLNCDLVISENICDTIGLNNKMVEVDLKGKSTKTKVCELNYEDIDKF